MNRGSAIGEPDQIVIDVASMRPRFMNRGSANAPTESIHDT